MTKRDRQFCSGLLSPVRAGSALALIIAAQLAAAPAAAQSRGSLSVTATVQPSCVVSTEGGAATSSCSNFGDGSVRIENDRRAGATGSDPAPAAESTTAQRRNDVTFVTITY